MPKLRPTVSTLAERLRAASLERRDLQKHDLREAIFRAASELLLEDGYAHFSLRKLAERIGYSATTIYRYYADKDALIFAVIEHGFSRFGQVVCDAASPHADPFERLRAMGRAYVRFGLENPVHYRVMFMERCDYWSHEDAHPESAAMQSYQALRDVVETCIATGRTSVTDVDGATHAIWAHVHGLVALALTMPFLESADVEAMTEASLTMTLEGLLRRD